MPDVTLIELLAGEIIDSSVVYGANALNVDILVINQGRNSKWLILLANRSFIVIGMLSACLTKDIISHFGTHYFAPASTSIFSISLKPLFIAFSNGETPLLSFKFTFAPCFIKIFTISSSPNSVDIDKGVFLK